MSQMYRIILQNWYILQSDHHHRSSCHPSRCSWSPSPMLPTSQSLSHLVTANLFSMRVLLFVHCFLLDSTYEWNHMVSVFAWLISLNISKVHYVVSNGRISFIYGWILLCYPIVCLIHIRCVNILYTDVCVCVCVCVCEHLYPSIPLIDT